MPGDSDTQRKLLTLSLHWPVIWASTGSTPSVIRQMLLLFTSLGSVAFIMKALRQASTAFPTSIRTTQENVYASRVTLNPRPGLDCTNGSKRSGQEPAARAPSPGACRKPVHDGECRD